jgi:general secretion pathway protein A
MEPEDQRYLTYWHLQEHPFNNTPDPKYLYLSPQHEEALARLLYTVQHEGRGAAVLTGTFGCGKSLLAQELIRQLTQHSKYRVAYLTNPQMGLVDLLRGVVRRLMAIQLPAKIADISIDYLLELLEQTLNDQLREGRSTVVIVDEAHAILDPSVFEGFRLLLNFQTTDRFLLTLLLIGQEDLLRMINDLKPLEQRISLKATLAPFEPADTPKYISHRLKTAGCDRPGLLFTDESLRLIHNRSGGIPRRINRLCDLALLEGCWRQRPQVDSDVISVLEE